MKKEKYRRRKKTGPKKKKKIIISIILLTLSLGSVIYFSIPFIKDYYDGWKDQQLLSKIKDYDSTKLTVDERLAQKPDIENLRQTYNEDIQGWIYIPGTNIDEPVVQGVNNWDYLYYNYDGSYNGLGAIFLDVKASPDMSMQTTFMFGHETYNGLKFSQIKKYLDKDFAKTYKRIYYFSKDKKQYTYEVLGIQLVESKNNLYIKENLKRSDEDTQYLIDTLKTFDNIDQSKVENLTKDDSILVLGTCVDNVDTGHRYYLVAKLVETTDY